MLRCCGGPIFLGGFHSLKLYRASLRLTTFHVEIKGIRNISCKKHFQNVIG